MLHEIMTYFISTYIPYNTPPPHGVDGIPHKLKEEISRRHFLWKADSGLRSILVENKHFITIVTSNDQCLSFSGNR